MYGSGAERKEKDGLRHGGPRLCKILDIYVLLEVNLIRSVKVSEGSLCATLVTPRGPALTKKGTP